MVKLTDQWIRMVVITFLHLMCYFHCHLQHSALCNLSSSITTQRPSVEGEVQYGSSTPLSAIKGSGEAICGHFLLTPRLLVVRRAKEKGRKGG